MQRNLIFLLQQIAFRLQSEGTLGCIKCYFQIFINLQVMVTEGPAGEESSVYDITLSEIHQNM